MTTNWAAALAISGLVTLVVVAIAPRVPRASLGTRRWLGVAGAFTLLFVTLLSDLPFGTATSAQFWADHALATGMVTTALLVGLGYLAVDSRVEQERARVERERDAEFDDLLTAMRDDLLHSHLIYTVSASVVMTGSVKTEDRLPDHDGTLRRAREALDEVAMIHDSASTWLTVMSLSHIPRAVGLPRSLARLRHDLNHLRYAHSELVETLQLIAPEEPLGLVGYGCLSDSLKKVEAKRGEVQGAFGQVSDAVFMARTKVAHTMERPGSAPADDEYREESFSDAWDRFLLTEAQND